MFLSAAALPNAGVAPPQGAETQTQLINIPEGAAGTRATLKIMARLVRETRIQPSIRNLAASMVQDLEGQNYTDEVRHLFNFVRDAIRYLQDTNGVELIQNPHVTLQIQAGDCDDKATLLAALLESIGHPCRFIAVGYTEPGQFEHVYVETKIGGDWVSADPTENVDLGWAPMPPYTDDIVTAIMREHI